MSELIYNDLTHIVIGCFFEIHNSIGVGFDEKAYHNGLKHYFIKNGIDHFSKPRKSIIHRGLKVREFEADFIVFDKIILELKTLQSKFIQTNYVQIISELKLWEMQLGLLVNFGLPKVKIERIPFSPKVITTNEDYSYIRNDLTQNDKEILADLREAVLYIAKIHGLGYGDSIYNKLFMAELDHMKIRYQNRIPININFDEKIISVFKMKPILIENRIICEIKALKDKIDFYDISRIQSYLKALDLKIGIIINFGKNILEIRSVRA